MSFQDTWPTAPVEDTASASDAPVPGLYTVAVDNAKAFTSKAGDDWVVLELRGIDGKADGHEWSLMQGFKSQKQASFTKRVCRDLGVDIDTVSSLDELDTALQPIIGRYLTVEVKQNGDYRNTYIQGLVEGTPAAAQGDIPTTVDDPPPQPAASGDDEPIPF